MSDNPRPVKVVPQREARGDARRERWREHRKARRVEFVEAAVRAIGKHGAEVGMDDIAAEAGVSKPVLYRHFSDKSDLYVAVGEWGTELLMQRLRPEFDQSGSPNQRIRRLLDAYLGTIEQYPELYRFVVQRTFADRPVRSDPVSAEKTVIANSLSRILGEYLRALGLDSGGVEAWSHGLVGMVQASGDWWLDRQSMSRNDLTDYLAQIIWFAIDGVLRSAGLVIDPDEPLDIDTDLRVVPDEGQEETDHG
ncbi:TetR/AcrR family transcriptional regulator [Saccharopolyspora sp. K220]|uniref:TetR/AcrR family transcriptional regulator n=1 Tax=Saccharopolyspora soli TaxID=2926618 RepID=UPI001F58802C|nr:TetR/AcrR family transcriptional regulator [Saccharopolyspora soli]MCI2417755.1 TetR/AcrR family transcriptional regulator [Saccharopolyspora soli]